VSKNLKFPVSETKFHNLHQRMDKVGLREEDLHESYFKTVKSGGKAGLIGVMLFHPASGIRVRCQRERSQGINRFLARRMLVEQLEKRACRALEKLASLQGPKPEPLSTEPPQIIKLQLPPEHWGFGTDIPLVYEHSEEKT